MPEPRSVSVTLLRYFFRRFFENDLVESAGDTVTTVVRALSIVAVPGLMVTFFLQNQYPQRSAWGRIEDHYFFTLYSFLAMAGVAVFEWEMLFPDRLDFLVLSPLPLRRRELLGAKAAALVTFLALFLVAANIFGLGLLPAVSNDHFGLHLWAHALAVTCAGIFGASAILAAGGVLLCTLPARAFRLISPFLQMLVVTALTLLLIHYARCADTLDSTLSTPLDTAQFVPTFWFLGMYEYVLRGASAASFAQPMMRHALLATLAALVLVIVTYPLAWVRMKRMAIEGEAGLRTRPTLRTGTLSELLFPLAPRRAVVSFIGQTIARNSRYQVYLALYCGVGLALAVACAVTLVPRGASVYAVLSPEGMRAVVPLLIFWLVAGLRMAYALPLNLPARWVFRVTGANRENCVSAARVSARVCGLLLLCVLLPVLWWARSSDMEFVVQAVCGVCLCSLMVDGLMFADRGIPFAQPRSPGRSNLPLMLTLFIGVLPVFCLCVIRTEVWLERKPFYLLAVAFLVPAVHRSVTALRRRSQPDLEDGDEIEPEFQLLGLSAE